MQRVLHLEIIVLSTYTVENCTEAIPDEDTRLRLADAHTLMIANTYGAAVPIAEPLEQPRAIEKRVKGAAFNG